MPFLSIRRRPALEMRRRTQRFSLSTQKRRYCRFGRNRRLVLLLAWETLFPTIGPLPVTSQTRAIAALSLEPAGTRRARLTSPLRGRYPAGDASKAHDYSRLPSSPRRRG